MTRAGIWMDPVRAAVHLDRAQLAILAAARCAVGIAVPLVAGDLSGHPLVGVEAAVGALTTGVASLQGTYRSRLQIMAVAALAFALSAFVGATVGHHEILSVAVTAVWGLAAGFLVLFGQAMSVVGLLAIIGLVVFSQFALTPTQAGLTALWALCGGLVQVLLVPLTWPLQRSPVERRASSTAYQQLAEHLRSLLGDPSALLDPAALDEFRSALQETQPFGDPAAAAAYRALADEAERIRLQSAVIARTRARLACTPNPGPDVTRHWTDEATHALDQAIEATAETLDAVAEALHSGRATAVAPDHHDRFRDAVERLRAISAARPEPDQAVLTQAVDAVTALAGQLRAVVHLTAIAAGTQLSTPPADATTDNAPCAAASSEAGHEPSPAPPPLVGTSGDFLDTVRANLTFTSEAFRHAVRVGATLAVAVAVAHLFPFGHGYWLPMTVMIVLKPDFAATLSRGVARSIGTLVGAGLVTLLLAALRPSAAGLITLTVLLYALSIAVLRASYAVYSVAIASLVVVLLGFTGAPAASLAADRAFYTVLGALLALGAYAAWPTWEGSRVAERVADLVETDGRYGAALLHAWADPARADRPALQRLRLAARLARTNAEASVSRWLSEPTGRRSSVPSRLDSKTAHGLLAAVRRYVWAALILHSQLPPDGPRRIELERLADELHRTLTWVGAALRHGGTSTDLPPLRATQVALASSLLHPRRADGDDARAAPTDLLLVGETDLMVDAAHTLVHLVGSAPTPLQRPIDG